MRLTGLLALALLVPTACGGTSAGGRSAGGTSAGGTSAKSNPAASVQPSQGTLYERLGGVDTLRILVDNWILEAASDPRIRDFFVDADMGRLKLRLVERLCVLTDGPCMYRGAELREHHAPLGIEERHMRAFLDDLDPALGRAEITGDPARELREALLVLGAQIGAEIGE